MIKVVHYTTQDGKDYFGEWLENQDDKAVARVQKRIDRIQLGNFGNRKSVGKGVSEFRIDVGPGYRVYYGRDGQDLVILLAGGTKKRQNADIETAQLNWKQYKQEKRNANRRTSR